MCVCVCVCVHKAQFHRPKLCCVYILCRHTSTHYHSLTFEIILAVDTHTFLFLCNTVTSNNSSNEAKKLTEYVVCIYLFSTHLTLENFFL